MMMEKLRRIHSTSPKVIDLHAAGQSHDTKIVSERQKQAKL
jgi:hypothetical protein